MQREKGRNGEGHPLVVYILGGIQLNKIIIERQSWGTGCFIRIKELASGCIKINQFPRGHEFKSGSWSRDTSKSRGWSWLHLTKKFGLGRAFNSRIWFWDASKSGSFPQAWTKIMKLASGVHPNPGVSFRYASKSRSWPQFLSNICTPLGSSFLLELSCL